MAVLFVITQNWEGGWETLKFLNRQMDQQNVAYSHNEILTLQFKKMDY